MSIIKNGDIQNDAQADDNNRPPSTKEEIAAAVAACYGGKVDMNEIGDSLAKMSGIPSSGKPVKNVEKKEMKKIEQVEKKVEKVEKKKTEKREKKECDCKCPNEKNGGCACDVKLIDVDEFSKACQSLDINAKMCKMFSVKNEDNSIQSFLRSINQKIFNETQSGGFSTNIKFRVTKNEWINISHIMDWYKARGFEILNYQMVTPPYESGGVMEHTFVISWANA